MTKGWAVVVLALAAGCGGHAAPRPTPLPSSTAVGMPVVAVVDKDGGLAVYGVKGTTATLLRRLDGPEGAKAESVSVSGGDAPVVCAVWAASPSSIACYDAGDGARHDVALGTSLAPVRVAVSYDASRVAWATDPAKDSPEAEGDVYWAALPGGTPTRFGSRPSASPLQSGFCCGTSIDALAWQGDDALVVMHGHESDDGSHLAVVPLAEAAVAGWTAGRAVDPPRSDRLKGFDAYDGVVSGAAGTRLLGYERTVGTTDTSVTRAVAFDTSTGEVVEVVAVPLPGRDVTQVSGGAKGVLYVTSGTDGDRVYWRAPGQAHGTPLTGLPVGFKAAVAQA